MLSDAAQCVQQDTEIESSLLEDGDHDEHHDDDHSDAEEGHDDHHKEEEHDDHHDDDAHDDHHKEGDDDAHDDHHKEDDDDAHDDHHKEGDEDGHDDHHDEHDDDAHGDHEDSDGESHSEFHVTWAFNCSKPEQLTSIDVKLFSLFSGFEEIDVSLAGDNRQDAYELTPESTRIDL